MVLPSFLFLYVFYQICSQKSIYLQTYSQKEFKVLRTIEYLRFYMCVKVHFCEQKSPHVSMGGVKSTSFGEEAGKGVPFGRWGTVTWKSGVPWLRLFTIQKTKQ